MRDAFGFPESGMPVLKDVRGVVQIDAMNPILGSGFLKHEKGTGKVYIGDAVPYSGATGSVNLGYNYVYAYGFITTNWNVQIYDGQSSWFGLGAGFGNTQEWEGLSSVCVRLYNTSWTQAPFIYFDGVYESFDSSTPISVEQCGQTDGSGLITAPAYPKWTHTHMIKIRTIERTELWIPAYTRSTGGGGGSGSGV